MPAMIVKVFNFSVSLSEPSPRTVEVKGRLYAIENQELIEVQGTTRGFIPSEDALHFDLDFGDVLQLSITDIVHGAPLSEFGCKVSIHEAEGTALKLYDVLDNNLPKKLIMVFELKGGEVLKRYARSITSRAEWRSRKTEIAQLLGVRESELSKLIAE